jgi:tetratricopeptide (TPR) repeat protein
MNTQKKEILSYIENISLITLGILFLGLPLVFTSLTTDAFALPKQMLLVTAIIISLLLYGIRMLVEGKVRIRTTPFDLPLLLLTIVVLISSLLAVNRYDALISFIPFLFAVLTYYVIVNVIRDENSLLFILSALVLGASLSAILAVLSFFKIYLLPFQYTHAQAFTPFGFLLDQAVYFALVLPMAGYFAYPLLSSLFTKDAPQLPGEDSMASLVEPRRGRDMNTKALGFAIASLVIFLGLAVTVYLLLTTQKPVILPLIDGFQISFAAISRDTGRILQSFLFGSGFGTFLTDFTRFKEASYNINPTLWAFTFFRSSNFVLEVLATTGLLGLLSYLFLIYRILRERSFFIPLVVTVIATFIFPFSYTLLVTLFIMLGIFAVVRAHQAPKRYADLELYFTAVKRKQDEPAQSTYVRFLPILFFTVLILAVGTLGYFSTRYILADMTFQKSLVAASQNNGAATYQLQRNAIGMFPYRDSYYRVFSQTNLALANSLASAQPQGASPSADVQRNILTLIQQSINAGRSAVSISPQTSLNWNNLSSIYRALIGFGENADRFAVLTNQQAVVLDTNNPQQYINLGGIYYQLGAWNEAAREFQNALKLKPDYANAYYNLGHTLESAGDLPSALIAYQRVQQLVGADPESVKKIEEEITALQEKIGSQPVTQQPLEGEQPAEGQGPIEVNQPEAQLPERNPRVEIPGPGASISPTPTSSVTPSPIRATGSVTPIRTVTPTTRP